MLVDKLMNLQTTQSGPLVLVPLSLFNEIVESLGGNVTTHKWQAETIEEFAVEHCTPKERRILRALAAAEGKTVKDFGLKEEQMYVHVFRLREKLIDWDAPMRVDTVRCEGYRLRWLER